MLGHKPRVFKPHPAVCLDDLVPQDNFYRQVEECLDLDFVHSENDKISSQRDELVELEAHFLGLQAQLQARD